MRVFLQVKNRDKEQEQEKTTPTPGPAEIENFRGWVPGGELALFLRIKLLNTQPFVIPATAGIGSIKLKNGISE